MAPKVGILLHFKLENRFLPMKYNNNIESLNKICNLN